MKSPCKATIKGWSPKDLDALIAGFKLIRYRNVFPGEYIVKAHGIPKFREALTNFTRSDPNHPYLACIPREIVPIIGEEPKP